MIGLIMFLVTLMLLIVGLPVAFIFAGMAIIFGVTNPRGCGFICLYSLSHHERDAKYDFNGNTFVYCHGYCLAKNQTRREAFRGHE